MAFKSVISLMIFIAFATEVISSSYSDSSFGARKENKPKGNNPKAKVSPEHGLVRYYQVPAESEMSMIQPPQPHQICVCFNPQCQYSPFQHPYYCKCPGCVMGRPHCIQEIATLQKRAGMLPPKHVVPEEDITDEYETTTEVISTQRAVASSSEKSRNTGKRPSRPRGSTTSTTTTTPAAETTTMTSFPSTSLFEITPGKSVPETNKTRTVAEEGKIKTSSAHSQKKKPTKPHNNQPSGYPINIFPVSVLVPQGAKHNNFDHNVLKQLISNYFYGKTSSNFGNNVRLPRMEPLRRIVCQNGECAGELNELESTANNKV